MNKPINNQTLLWFNLLVTMAVAIGCSQTPKQVNRALYYWQTTFAPTQAEQQLIARLNVEKLYIRFFDVDINATGQQPVPVAPIVFEHTPAASLKIVPVVFITNRTLKDTSKNHTATLAKQLVQKVQTMAQAKGITFNELQIDCDWTERTANSYFELLKAIQQDLPQKRLTATIRLHQVKFFKKTGVPPVARGMLMFYNMGKLKAAETENSILDLTTARQYLVNFDQYPLSLDLALPVFSWGVVLRDGKVVRLIHDMRHADLANDPRFEAIGNNSYHQLQSDFIEGEYGYRHDVIRIEQTDPSLSKEAAALAAGVIKNHQLTVSLYHLHAKLPEHYNYEALEAIYSAVR